MKVILLEDVKSLGKKGEIVEVNEGYARNFILKKKVGIEASAKNMNDLKLKKANEMLVRGAIYIATHPDTVCPTKDISMPDVGSFIKLLEASTFGRLPDAIIGKPNSIAGNEIVRATGLTPDQITMVGDRLYTDIMFGINSGFNTILVYSGETTKEMLAKSNVSPSIQFEDLNEIVKYL